MVDRQGQLAYCKQYFYETIETQYPQPSLVILHQVPATDGRGDPKNVLPRWLGADLGIFPDTCRDSTFDRTNG
jgi:hypothetical protein